VEFIKISTVFGAAVSEGFQGGQLFGRSRGDGECEGKGRWSAKIDHAGFVGMEAESAVADDGAVTRGLRHLEGAASFLANCTHW
jgi:hypothetical protein